MRQYDHKKIEKKWQKEWAKKKLYQTLDKVKDKKNFYLLTEFPYPSGNLHVGHWYAFAVPDILARFKRMEGKNVMYPIGFDAFGLPAENAAIKNNLNPQKWTKGNIAYMKKQLTSMGASFDWSREVQTIDPQYYKWTQWLFLQFFKKGLAYKKDTPVNWCPQDKTVLANEQVVNGKCERCGSEVEQRSMLQWNLKITDYADRLAEDLTALDWPHQIKESQRNWIGKSEGAEIDFPLAIAADTKYKFVILHGYQSRADRPRWRWVKEELEKAGHEVIIPQLPNTDEPVEAEQVETALAAADYDENTVLVGHSLGAVVAMKALQKLNKKIARLILIAPAIDPAFPSAVVRPFHKHFKWDIDYELLKRLAPSRLLLSDLKEPAVRVNYIKWLAPRIDARLVETLAVKEHFVADKEPDILMWLRPTIRIFTTRPDTLFGATYLVLSPEHPWVKLALKHKTVLTNNDEIQKYVTAAGKKTELERQENKEKTGVRIEGVKAINPATGEKIPVFVADYVLATYGTGAIMAVPAHDERDFEFAKKFDLPVREVVIEQVNPRAADGVFRKIGIAIVENSKSEVLMQSITHGNDVYHSLPGGGIDEGESEEQGVIREVVEETGYTNFTDIRKIGTVEANYFNPIRKINRQAWATCYVLRLKDEMQQEQQLTEMEKRVKIENFWVSKQKALELLSGKSASSGEDLPLFKRYLAGHAQSFTGDGILVNSGEFDGVTTAEAKAKIAEKFGTKKTTYKMRDWVVSRQRYWGVPIPIIHCPKCGDVAVPDKDLPVKLPEIKDYLPTGGKSPLAKVKKFVQVKCPQCKGGAERETDTLDTFVDSSWYFQRYTDPKNKKTFADAKKLAAWMPVDLYSGGAEHTTMHLLYSRFWHKAMYDLGLVKDKEPYARRMNRSLIMGPDGQKMSKSRGNVIDPDEVVANLGADTVRMYLAFIGPYNEVASYPWNPDGVVGVRRFLERVWRLHEKLSKQANDDVERALHVCIKKLTDDIPLLKFNTSIAGLMTFLNEAEEKGITKAQYLVLLRLLAPFAPHTAEELWHMLGNKKSVHLEKWPKYDTKKLKTDTISIAVQVNGKSRGQVVVAADASEAEVRKAAEEAVAKWLEGREVARVIFVPNRLINLVLA